MLGMQWMMPILCLKQQNSAILQLAKEFDVDGS
jgi:hypothetical protein